MPEPRTPDDQRVEPDVDSPTQAWPAPGGPPSGTAGEPSATSPTPTPSSRSPYEPASSLGPTQVASVAEDGPAADAAASSRSRTRLRWGLALVGVLIVAAASILIV